MNAEAVGWIQAITGLVAALGALVVAWVAFRQWGHAIQQRHEETQHRERDLQWRQAEQGRKVLDELFLSDRHDGYYALVMTTLEEGEKEPCRFEDRFLPHTPELRRVNHALIMAALQNDQSPDDVDAFIKGCFDDLFYYLDRIGFFLERGFLTLADVQSPLEYYAVRMARTVQQRAVYERYIHRIRAQRALGLLRQFASWQPAQSPGAGAA